MARPHGTKYIETPAESFKRLVEQYKKENPDDILNKPYQSEFFKSGKAKELFKQLIKK